MDESTNEVLAAVVMPATVAAVTIQKELITPEQAAAWLQSNNPFNRKLREATWKRYSADMKAGNFLFNPADPICFDVHGRLINGQHRCAGCVDASVGFWAMVARNCDPDSYVVMDAGQNRSAADDLHQAGTENPITTAAVARLLTLDNKEALNLSQVKVTRSEIKQTVGRNGIEIKAALAFISGLAELPTEIAEARAAFCYLRFFRQNPDKARQFFNALNNPVELAAGSPIILLQKALQRLKKTGRNMRAQDVLGLIFKAWVMFRDGRTGAVLQLRKGDDWTNIDSRLVTMPKETAAA